MNDSSNCHACFATADAVSADFWSERRRFLSGLLPVRRRTVTITFQKANGRHAQACKTTTRLAV